MERPNNYPGAPFPFQPPPGYRPPQPFEGDCVFPTRVPAWPRTECLPRPCPSQGFWPAQSSAGPTTAHQQPPVWAGPWSTTTATPQVPTEEQGQFSRVTSAAYQRHLQQTQPGAQTTNTPAIEASRLEAEANKARDLADRAEELLESVLAAEKKAVQRVDELEREVAELKKYKGEKASLGACSIDELKRIDEALKQGRKNVKAALQAKEKDQDARPECTVCMDKPRETVFLPCKHMACCYECGKQLKTCPICRSAVQTTVFVHHC